MPINYITKEDVTAFEGVVKGAVGSDTNLLDLYQKISQQSAIYPGKGTPIGLDYVALKGCGEAGEFAEHVGKAMRDDSLIDTVDVRESTANSEVKVATCYFRPLTKERKEALIKEIGDELWYLAAKCNELGISLSDVAIGNLKKLSSRSERGKLQGSGDDR